MSLIGIHFPPPEADDEITLHADYQGADYQEKTVGTNCHIMI